MNPTGESYDDITGTTAHLPIPNQAVHLFRQRCPQAAGMDNAETMDLIETLAAPIVAAHLRHIADTHQYDGGVVSVDMLRYHAHELDGDT